MARIVLFCVFVVFFRAGSAFAESERLSIPPVVQQTPVWCWAAVSEMVLRHYRFPNLNPAGNYQCGIVGSLGGICAHDCGSCVTAIGSTHQMAGVIENYQDLSDHFARRHRGRHFIVRAWGPLSPRRIAREIDEGDPVVAGISPSGMGWRYPDGMSEHVALIVGYRASRERFLVLVNDPMPYRRFGRDPYLAAGARSSRGGQYWVNYEAFVDRLSYKDTIYFD